MRAVVALLAAAMTQAAVAQEPVRLSAAGKAAPVALFARKGQGILERAGLTPAKETK